MLYTRKPGTQNQEHGVGAVSIWIIQRSLLVLNWQKMKITQI